ncbi:MAG: DNA polymerase [Pseudomonadota bacterium]
MIYLRKTSLCKKCPFGGNEWVWGQGDTESGIAFIGEAPGAEEVYHKQPFVGKAGRYFRYHLSQVGINASTCYFTNVICCRPPDNDMTTLDAKEAVKCCKPGLEEEIEYLLKRGIKVVSPVGNHSAHAFGLTDRIGKIRGSVYNHGEYLLIPTHHPSGVMRREVNRGIMDEWIWHDDLNKIREHASEPYVPFQEHFNLFPTVEDLEKFAISCTNQFVGVDIETTSLRPWGGEIFCLSLAKGPSSWRGNKTDQDLIKEAGDSKIHRAICVPFYKKGFVPYWSKKDSAKVSKLLNFIFSKSKLVFQNAPFDVGWLLWKGYKIDFEQIWHDTLILHHTIYPELPHNLEFITSIYGETPYWKGPYKDRNTNIEGMDDEVLRLYNARDAQVLLEDLEGLLEDLYEHNMETLYYEEAHPMIELVMEMSFNGILLDKKALNEWKLQAQDEITEIKVKLIRQGFLPEPIKKTAPLKKNESEYIDTFNLASDQDLRWFLFGIPPSKFSHLQDYERKKPGTKVYDELSALKILKENVAPIVKVRYEGRQSRKTGVIQVDKRGLLGLRIQAQNRLKAISELKRPTDKHKEESDNLASLIRWLGLFSEYRGLAKLLSTYSSFPTALDGRVRCSFSIHGTKTGRLSSDSPNLQNIPKRNKVIRKAFIAQPGCRLLSGDYSNLEVRVLAYITRDELLIEEVEQKNVHDENTKTLFNLTKEDLLWEEARDGAKVFMFGGLCYGGSPREIYENILMKCPNLTLTFSTFEESMKRWMEAHNGYRTWAEGQRTQALATRTVSTNFGRIRQLLGSERDIEKEALNTPIQGTAASIVNRAGVELLHSLRESKLKGKILLQVHDQFLLEVEEEDLQETALLVRKKMEMPFKIGDREVSFPVDLEVGKTWGTLEAYEENNT